MFRFPTEYNLSCMRGWAISVCFLRSKDGQICGRINFWTSKERMREYVQVCSEGRVEMLAFVRTPLAHDGTAAKAHIASLLAYFAHSDDAISRLAEEVFAEIFKCGMSEDAPTWSEHKVARPILKEVCRSWAGENKDRRCSADIFMGAINARGPSSTHDLLFELFHRAFEAGRNFAREHPTSHAA